jgi:fimbrial chaperone protein
VVSARRKRLAAVSAAALGAPLILCAYGSAVAQTEVRGLTVTPVTIELAPRQMTAVLTLENHTDREADFQVRPYIWDQPQGDDRLTPTEALVASPPLGKIAVGASQVVRLVLRQPAQGREASYRILLDQVPPPPEPGVVGLALRLSIPIFAAPPVRVAPHLRWSLERSGAGYELVAVNDGGRHEAVRDLALTGADGRRLQLDPNVLPYVLAGATRRWRILTPNFAPSREALRLTAHASGGVIDQAVSAPSVAP